MAIPQSVYSNILQATNACHGAQLARPFKTGEKVFHLEKGHYGISGPTYVKAFLFIHVATDAELDAYKAKGYDVFPDSSHSGPFAVKPIALGQVPDSEASEWKQWDEY